MARHDVCPSTMTVENLADWIQANKVETSNHVEKFPLDQDEINQFQKDATLATIQINKLKDVLKYFSDTIKNGTPWDSMVNDNKPLGVTIPPTKGLKVLEANRNFACLQLEKGYREEVTLIYFLPWPEFEKMVALDIEGTEWTKYSRKMTSDEIRQHGKPILSASVEMTAVLEKSGLEIEKVDGKTATLRKKKKKPDLLDDAEDRVKAFKDDSNISEVPFEDEKDGSQIDELNL